MLAAMGILRIHMTTRVSLTLARLLVEGGLEWLTAIAIYVREIVESIGKVFSGRAPLSLSPAASADTPNTMEGHVIIPVSTVEDAKKGR